MQTCEQCGGVNNVQITDTDDGEIYLCSKCFRMSGYDVFGWFWNLVYKIFG